MFFSCLIHSARFSFIWGVEASKESSSAFCFSSEGFPFWYQGEQIVSISTAAPFHWLFGFHSALEKTTQTFQKKWSVLKSAFWRQKTLFNHDSWHEFLSFPLYFLETWNFAMISIVIIEKTRRLIYFFRGLKNGNHFNPK